ncbi:hypothetical protein KXX06_007566 [Aspergillus fumigatus]|nr:hypothetical protein KXX06_007566 [Aspergillus fumigatus]
MKATPLLIAWHNDNAPIYSVHFDPNGKGRLATAGNDNNVRLWKVESIGEDRKVTYLSTLVKHTQAVNVVRFSPKGEMLASAGDDGNVLLWVPSELQTQPGLGEDRSDDKETWRVKHMCRSSGAEIYDLAWSPDGVFIITGSMDNIARIYNAQTGQMVRQIAEHSHYVQGVAWDPLNEFVATQSSDRSVHIYSLKTKDGQFTLTSHGKFLKMDLPAKRISSSSPAPPELSIRSQPASGNSIAIASPATSTPGTPLTSHLPMDPPPVSHSRRSSFGSSPSIRRSASPAPSLPLPAVKPLEVASPNVLVYIYTRAGFNKPPISHLPGHKKPSVAVKCSPILYTLRKAPQPARHITLDTSSGEESFASLPEPVVSTKPTPDKPSMEPPSTPSASESSKTNTVSKNAENEGASAGQNPSPVFSLPYRIVYAVATQDAVLVYDTQQQTPLCVVSNLHFATFTDLTWSDDGLTLIMSSSDGFCSTLSFAPGELGQPYTPPAGTAQHPASASTTSANQAPQPSPANNPSPLKLSQPSLSSSPAQPAEVPPASPARSNSVCSMTTQSPIQQVTAQQSGDFVVNNPTPTLGSVPLVTAANSAQPPILPFTTPPQTPMSAVAQSGANSVSNSVLGKRDISESEKEDSKDQSSVPQVQQPKKRRVAPTLISAGTNSNPPSSSSPNHEVS